MSTEFKDRLGRTLKVGDEVVFASYFLPGLTNGIITKLGRLNVTVERTHNPYQDKPESFRPEDVVKV